MTQLVSIAIATFNGEKYLREQLESIYNQTYKHIEIVVSDDNSTDSTILILEDYKKKHGLIYSINDTNIGFVKNFEKVLGMCNGDYIALCDQDDIWLPNKIEVLLSEIDNNSLICSDAIVINSTGNPIAQSMYSHTKRKFYHTDHFHHLLYNNYISGCTMLVKKELLIEAIPFPEHISYHDWWLAIVASLVGSIGFVNEPLIKYRFHDNNQTSTGLKYKYKSIINKISEFRKKRNSDYFKKEIVWMEELLNKELLDDSKKKLINERITFYKNIYDSIIHFKSAYIALKHRHYMLSQRNSMDKLLFILMSLFAH